MTEQNQDPYGSRIDIHEASDEEFLKLLIGTNGGNILVQKALADAGIEPEAMFGYFAAAKLNNQFVSRLKRIQLTANAVRLREFINHVPTGKMTNWHKELRVDHPDLSKGWAMSDLVRAWIWKKSLPDELVKLSSFNAVAENRMIPTSHNP